MPNPSHDSVDDIQKQMDKESLAYLMHLIDDIAERRIYVSIVENGAISPLIGGISITRGFKRGSFVDSRGLYYHSSDVVRVDIHKSDGVICPTIYIER